jgi:hypothetical protein
MISCSSKLGNLAQGNGSVWFIPLTNSSYLCNPVLASLWFKTIPSLKKKMYDKIATAYLRERTHSSLLTSLHESILSQKMSKIAKINVVDIFPSTGVKIIVFRTLRYVY